MQPWDHIALLYWRQLMADLGSAPNMSVGDMHRRKAARRVIALRELFFQTAQRSGATKLMEVGAGNAETARRFGEEDPSRQALAFEASPQNFEKGSAQPFPPNVQYLHFAVCKKPGDVEFLVSEDQRYEQWGSLRKRVKNRVATLPVRVSSITMDQAANRLDASRHRDIALWIDVEGAALEVLQSGKEIVKNRTNLIYVEVQDDEVYENSRDSLMIIEHLLKNGFVPIARDNQFPSVWNLIALHSTAFVPCQSVIIDWWTREQKHIQEAG